MRVWRFDGVHRLAWVVIVLLVLAVAVFAMAAGFSRLRGEAVPAGTSVGALEAGALHRQSVSSGICPLGLHQVVFGGRESLPLPV
ncbi:MAG: hypothetical protein NTU91_03080 [Chloroflexi bacterium]|jgi:hypothetical protein|nr:hypothetical protein [Chloroflexota bacterium]